MREFICVCVGVCVCACVYVCVSVYLHRETRKYPPTHMQHTLRQRRSWPPRPGTSARLALRLEHPATEQVCRDKSWSSASLCIRHLAEKEREGERDSAREREREGGKEGGREK